MRASIYRLKSNGVPLPRPDIPVVGELRMRPEEIGNVKMRVARLLGGTHELLPALLKAEAQVFSAHGIVIHGVELLSRGRQKSTSRPVPQTWWAFILTESGIVQYDGEDPLEAIADFTRLGPDYLVGGRKE